MKDKVVLITGASSGIGAGTAVHLASKGCLLSLTGRNGNGLRDTLEQCLVAGATEDKILLISADVSKEKDLGKIIDETIRKFGRLDVLVNNAGVSVMETLEQTTTFDYDRTMNTNTRAVFFLTQLAMPHLIESKGNVVNVSSIAALRASRTFVAYGMSKAALDHFSRSVALEVAPHKVRVNTVNPGYVPTNIARDWTFLFPDSLVASTHALGRAGTVEEIAKVIGFLADDEQSSFITGVSLVVDGGSLLMGPSLE